MRSLAGIFLLLSFSSIIHPWLGWVWLAAVLIGAPLAWAKLKSVSLTEGFRVLDDTLYQGERAIVMISLLVMAVFVFIDVVWRTYHSLDQKTAISFVVGFLVLCLIGGFTTRVPNLTWPKRLGLGLVAFVVVTGAIRLIGLAPNGFGWSQRLATVLIVWVGMLGASMATKEGRHIAVDAVKQVVPDKFKRAFEIAAGLLTVSLTLFLMLLSVSYLRGNWTDWVGSDYRAFVFESLNAPYWVATLPIPIGFGIMGLRFFSVVFVGHKKVDILTSVGAKSSEASS